MRVLVIADRFGPGRGAVSAAGQAGQGWSHQAPHDEVTPVGLSDGSAGFVEVIADRVGRSPSPTVVTGPLGDPVPAEILLAGQTAYLDAAQAGGLHLLRPADVGADPDGRTSEGVGELLVTAREAGARRIVIGVGELASHDGGRGLLTALGAGPDLAGLPRLCRDWSDIDLVLAAADDLPLVGFQGASARLGERGLPPEITQRFEGQLGAFAKALEETVQPARDLITGRPRRLAVAASAGVGGGVGLVLQVLGARTVPGASFLLDELGVSSLLPGALVVLAAPSYDWHSVQQGVVAETARAALASAAPTVVLAEHVGVGRREGMALGIAGMYGVRPGEDLRALAARVAGTWSPRR